MWALIGHLNVRYVNDNDDGRDGGGGGCNNNQRNKPIYSMQENLTSYFEIFAEMEQILLFRIPIFYYKFSELQRY